MNKKQMVKMNKDISKEIVNERTWIQTNYSQIKPLRLFTFTFTCPPSSLYVLSTLSLKWKSIEIKTIYLRTDIKTIYSSQESIICKQINFRAEDGFYFFV